MIAQVTACTVDLLKNSSKITYFSRDVGKAQRNGRQLPKAVNKTTEHSLTQTVPRTDWETHQLTVQSLVGEVPLSKAVISNWVAERTCISTSNNKVVEA